MQPNSMAKMLSCPCPMPILQMDKVRLREGQAHVPKLWGPRPCSHSYRRLCDSTQRLEHAPTGRAPSSAHHVSPFRCDPALIRLPGGAGGTDPDILGSPPLPH